MLFDLGPNDLFLRNAEKMGVDIAAVDTVVISHGHSDHGGALKLLLEKNHSAKLYVQEAAFDKHYTKVLGFYADVGIDASLKQHPQVVLTKGRAVIDDGLLLFSGVEAKELCSVSNRALYTRRVMLWFGRLQGGKTRYCAGILKICPTRIRSLVRPFSCLMASTVVP